MYYSIVPTPQLHLKEILILHQTTSIHKVNAIPKDTTLILKLALMNSRNRNVLTHAQSDKYLESHCQRTQSPNILALLYTHVQDFLVLAKGEQFTICFNYFCMEISSTFGLVHKSCILSLYLV